MQKEKLSALMDGELIDNELINSLSNDSELQQAWYRYHVIRDTLRNDAEQVLSINIADNVLAAIDAESTPYVAQPIDLISVEQPKPETWQKLPFWHKVKPWFTQIGQAGVAAGISLAVIVGVQQYNGTDAPATEIPTFNTFAGGNLVSPVSYGTSVGSEQSDIQDHRRHFAILQDYELQRRLHTEPLNFKEVKQSSEKQNDETSDTGLN